MNFLQDFRENYSHSFPNQKSLTRHATAVWNDPTFDRHVYKVQAELEKACLDAVTKNMKVKTEVEFVSNHIWINTMPVDQNVERVQS